MTHKDCGGTFELWRIPEHCYTFTKCRRCGFLIGGEATQKQINELMAIKVRPTIRRA